jgi:RNA polymerase sigma-70 factor, ECF subfamily
MSANPDRVPSDAELLAAVAEGDPEAFGVLYDQHAPWLLVRLRQRTASSDLADQVAQETFLVVWRDAGRFRGRGEVGAWIWGIAIRRLLWTPSVATPPRDGWRACSAAGGSRMRSAPRSRPWPRWSTAT